MNRKLVWNIIILSTYVITLVVLVFFINEKSNLHMDEVSSYCGANNSYDNSISIHVDYGIKYENPEDVWTRQMTVAAGNEFDYANTYNVMATDNHPPFYFYILHTICSLFPGVYSKWFAGIINLVCSIGILYFSQKTVFLLTEDKKSVVAASLFICFNGGMISAATYFRNYYIGILFVSAFIYILLKGLRKQNKLFYIATLTLFILGVMTHYYIAIFYFFISIFYVANKLINKRFKDLVGYVTTALLSAVAFIVMDFASVRTVFSGNDRSGEVMDNLSLPILMLLGKIVRCAKLVDTQVFSNLMIGIMVLIIALIIYSKLIKKDKLNIDKFWDYAICFGGIVGYVIFVSIITVYETPRYFYPVYAALLVITFCLLQNCTKDIKYTKAAYVSLLIVFVLSTALKFKANIHYLYRSTRPFLNASLEYGDTDCIFITEHSYDVNSSFYEIKNYRSVTFYNYDNYDEIANLDIEAENGILVSYNANCDIDSVNSVVLAKWPELVNIVEVGRHEGNITRYYYKQ